MKTSSCAAIERDRNVNRDFLAGIFQVAVDSVFQTQFLRGDFETRFGGFVDIQLIVRNRRHDNLPKVRKFAILFAV